MTGFTEALSYEFAEDNIQCYGISPGGADTDLRRDIMEESLKFDKGTNIELSTLYDNSEDKCASLVYSLFKSRPKYLSGKIISPIWDNVDNFFEKNGRIVMMILEI